MGVTVRRISRCHVPPYWSDFGSLIYFEVFDHNGTVFAPKQCLYQKVDDPVSCTAVWGRIWKFEILGSFRSPWFRAYTKAMFISKGSYGYGEPKNVIAFSVVRRITRCHVPPYVAEHGNLVIFEAFDHNRTVFAPK